MICKYRKISYGWPICSAENIGFQHPCYHELDGAFCLWFRAMPAMSDILAEAKELAAKYESSGYIHRDATLLLPRLIAECERLRSQRDNLARSLESALKLSPQVARLAERWREIAIDERARANFYSLLPEGGEDMWSEATEDVRRSRREQAARELCHVHVWENMAPNNHMTCSCGKTKE